MFDGQQLRRVMGLFATGVTIVTTRDAAGHPYGLTANAVSSLSLDPPLVLVCIDRKAETFPHFAASRCFVVNILAADQQELSRRFAVSGGDKFAGVAHTLNCDGVPVLAGTLGHLECRIVASHDGGDHVIHVGEAHAGQARGGAPLCYFAGAYRRLAEG